jgi:predicted nicotinamide N-methyase
VNLWELHGAVSAMHRERDRMIAEALAAPPPMPLECKLRTLQLAEAHAVLMRVPVANHIQLAHIRKAHATATAKCGNKTSGAPYHEALQAEFSRLQDSQPWYWDQLWPGGLAMARWLLGQPALVRGKTVLEFGTGIGLLAVCVALAGASRVVATDIEPAALRFVEQSAADNRVAPHVIRTVAWDWHEPVPREVEASGPLFDLVLLPDVLYDRSAVERLGQLAPTLVRPGGSLLFADGTDRVYGAAHTEELSETVCGDSSFRIASRESLLAGASAEDGGAAPERPVVIVRLERAHIPAHLVSMERRADGTTEYMFTCR